MKLAISQIYHLQREFPRKPKCDLCNTTMLCVVSMHISRGLLNHSKLKAISAWMLGVNVDQMQCEINVKYLKTFFNWTFVEAIP